MAALGAGALSAGGAAWGALAAGALAAALSFAPPHAALVLRAATRPALEFNTRVILYLETH